MYLSGDSKPKTVKKEVDVNIFRDLFKVTCPNCGKIFEQEIKYIITCPYCDWKTDGIQKPKGL